MLSIVLHPVHKTLYFTKAGWEHDWVLNAERLAHDEWMKHYKPATIALDAGGAQAASISPTSADQMIKTITLY